MTIIATIAVTLIAENQNSPSPNSRTEIRFAANSTPSTTSAVAHSGTANQYLTYLPATVISAMQVATPRPPSTSSR